MEPCAVTSNRRDGHTAVFKFRKERDRLSFFDEADEPPAAPRTAPRTARRRRRPGGTGRRPPSDQQAIQVRRLIAAGAILIVLILLVFGIHGCQISARNSSLKAYANNVSSLIQQSDQTGAQLFGQLSGGGGTANATALQNQINQTSVSANSELSHAKGLDVPDEMRQADQNLLLTLEMRRDGIADTAEHIQQALGTSTNKDAINAIAADMARFYASDVVYKGYTTTRIAAALHAAGIGVGGNNGVQIEPGQFLPDIQWLTPTFIAGKLGAQSPTPAGKPAPGLHGHSLDSVSVAGTTLQSGSTNTIPRSPAPSFMLNLTNGGQNTERNVICKVTISGASVSGQTTIPQTTAGQSTTCTVQLGSAPPAGSYTVTATVQPVPGEKNTANNTLSFPVTFQ
jgi:hypothetical protein